MTNVAPERGAGTGSRKEHLHSHDVEDEDGEEYDDPHVHGCTSCVMTACLDHAPGPSGTDGAFAQAEGKTCLIPAS